MSTCYIVDAFPAFLEFWPTIRHKSIDKQIDAWETSYMARWPELLAKQKACYAEDGEGGLSPTVPDVATMMAGREPPAEGGCPGEHG